MNRYVKATKGALLTKGTVKVLKQLESKDIKILTKQFGALSMKQLDIGKTSIQLMVNRQNNPNL